MTLNLIGMTMHAKANCQLLPDNIVDMARTDYLHPAALGDTMVQDDMTVRAEGDAVAKRDEGDVRARRKLEKIIAADFLSLGA